MRGALWRVRTPHALHKNRIVSAEGLDFSQLLMICGGPFGAIIADRRPSRPRHPHLEVFADLRSPHESSGARLETDFAHFCEKCERFLNFSNFALKKFRDQGLDFLSKDFLSKA